MLPFLVTALAGFVTGLSLIVAIGAQNAFVLKQGLQRRHVALVVAVCALSDLVLIMLGVGGVGLVIARAPAVLEVLRWAGAAFLVGYGLLAARRAVRGEHLDDVATARPLRRAAVLGICLALTWLNPHVYLDTVVLMGSIASTHGPVGRWWFAAGAGLASITWFTALGTGARLLIPLFRRPAAWRILNAVIAVIMVTLAVLLLLR